MLAPVEYLVDPKFRGKHAIYDYALKTQHSEAVTVPAPAELPGCDRQGAEGGGAHGLQGHRLPRPRAASTSGSATTARSTSSRSTRCPRSSPAPASTPPPRSRGSTSTASLDAVHDLGRGALEGSRTRRARRSRPTRRARAAEGGLHLQREARGAESERAATTPRPSTTRPKTLQAIREAIASLRPRGHRPRGQRPSCRSASRRRRSTWSSTSPRASRAATAKPRCPAMLELLDIPYTGSDPAALSIALDKALAKKMVRQHGILTPDFLLMSHRQGAPPQGAATSRSSSSRWPRARRRASSASRWCENEAELRELAPRDRRPLPPAGAGGELHRRPRVHGGHARRAAAQGAADHGGGLHRRRRRARLRLQRQARLDPPRPLRRARPSSSPASSARSSGPRAASSPRSAAATSPASTSGWTPRGRSTSSSATRCPGLTPGWSDLVMIAKAGGLEYRGAHRRDPLRRHPPLSGARARAEARGEVRRGRCPSGCGGRGASRERKRDAEARKRGDSAEARASDRRVASSLRPERFRAHSCV